GEDEGVVGCDETAHERGSETLAATVVVGEGMIRGTVPVIEVTVFDVDGAAPQEPGRDLELALVRAGEESPEFVDGGWGLHPGVMVAGDPIDASASQDVGLQRCQKAGMGAEGAGRTFRGFRCCRKQGKIGRASCRERGEG